jgi:hypothetical protein
MDGFKPFADGDVSMGVGGLTAENGEDRIAIYGNLDLSRDKVGLDFARTMRTLFDDIVRALESDAALPDALPPAPTPPAQNPPEDPLALPTGGLIGGS